MHRELIIIILLVITLCVADEPKGAPCDTEIKLKEGTAPLKIEITKDTNCVFHITNSNRKYDIMLRLQSIDFGATNTCDKKYLQFATDKDKLVDQVKYCTMPPSTVLLVDTETLWLSYHTDTATPQTGMIKFTGTAELLPKTLNLCAEKMLLMDDDTKSVKRTNESLLRDKECTLQVMSPDEHYNIAIKFTRVKFETTDEGCQKDFVKFASDEVALRTATLFCKEPPPDEYQTDGSALFLQYHADLNLVNSVGFEADIRRVFNFCKEKIVLTDNSSKVIIRTGDKLTMNKDCLITVISSDESYKIAVEFRKVQFGKTDDKCDRDYVEFAANAQDLINSKKYCDIPSPAEQIIESSSMVIAYHASSIDGTSSGFEATIERIKSSSAKWFSPSFTVLTTMLLLTANLGN